MGRQRLAPAPAGHAASAAHRLRLFGGSHAASAGVFQDTWEWDGTDWRQRTVTAAPSPRATQMAHDTQRGRTLLFSGEDRVSGVLTPGDTWEYGPTHPASFQSFGAGCAGSAGVPTLRALGLPWLGDRFSLRVERLPPGSSVLVWLSGSRSLWGALPLPLDLTGAGMPGCALRVSPHVTLPLFNFTGTADVSVPVPDDVVLLGHPVYSQALVADRAANSLGATTSNAGEARFGAR